jgi:type II secretory pathway pseudopilin PulG
MNATDQRKSKNRREGFVLPTVVFAVAVMSIIVVASLATSLDERRASRAVRESTLAEYVADAGLRQTYGAWPSTPVKAMNPGDSLDLGWQTLPNSGNAGKYRAVIHRVDNGGLQEYNVIVQGRRTGLNGGISTVIGVVGGVPLFSRAVYGGQLVWIQNATLDSFDSDVAAYNLATAGNNADVFSNGTMTLQKTTINGDAAAAGAITLNNSPVVSGTTTANVPAETPYDNIPCALPTGTYSPVTPELAAVGYTGNGVLSLASGTTLNLTGSQYVFRSVTMTGTSKLALPAGQHVDIQVQDSIYMAGGTIINTSHKATDLSFTQCGTPTNPAKTNYWGLTGGSDAFFSVYAPNNVVYALGNSAFYGAVISSIFYITGSAQFHYDEALARAASPKLQVQNSTWSQMSVN